MNIEGILRESYQRTLKALVMGTSPESLARARERAFVKALARQFEGSFEGEEFRVFSAYGRGNRPDFGGEQLLFEIEVCRVAGASTAERKSESFYIVTEALWQIEIELSQDWRRVVFAMNRLRCGAAGNKLVIAAAPGAAQERFLKTLEQPGAVPGEAFYLATIPHPRDWEDDEESLKMWQFVEGEWQAVM
ncbi:MAG: hypothetical protein OXG60_15515 [Chloroflexi bacterium]|nr:hypothetical protein [Chloroflexota bacterium]